MKIRNLVLGGFFIGTVSLVYNYLVFTVLGFYPDLTTAFEFLDFFDGSFYLVIFLKNFLVGIILVTLFSLGWENIQKDNLSGIFFFALYAIFAFVSFSIGDLILMKSSEGMLVLLLVEGVFETFIATIPIRFLSEK